MSNEDFYSDYVDFIDYRIFSQKAWSIMLTLSTIGFFLKKYGQFVVDFHSLVHFLQLNDKEAQIEKKTRKSLDIYWFF